MQFMEQENTGMNEKFWQLAVTLLLMASMAFMFVYNDFYKAMYCLAFVWLYREN